MTTDGRPLRRQRRSGSGCGDGSGRGGNRGHGRRDGSGRGAGKGAGAGQGQSSLTGRTATRALVALGAYVVQDIRDAEGLTRPMLRRAALRLACSPVAPVRRLGGAYLRMDPLAPDELPSRPDVIEVGGSTSGPRALPPAPEQNEDEDPGNDSGGGGVPR